MSTIAAAIELAWCAGFFDGEGNTNSLIKKSGGLSSIRFTVTQKNPLLLYRFREAIGGLGSIYNQTKTEGACKLQIANFEHVQYVMCLLWKYLGPIKREQYKKAVKFYISICYKPKFDEVSVRIRARYKARYKIYKKHSLAMMNKIRMYEYLKSYVPDPNHTFVNPFAKHIVE